MLIKKRAGAHPEKNVCVEVQTNNEKIISYQNKVTYSIYKLPVIYWVFTNVSTSLCLLQGNVMSTSNRLCRQIVQLVQPMTILPQEIVGFSMLLLLNYTTILGMFLNLQKSSKDSFKLVVVNRS